MGAGLPPVVAFTAEKTAVRPSSAQPKVSNVASAHAVAVVAQVVARELGVHHQLRQVLDDAKPNSQRPTLRMPLPQALALAPESMLSSAARAPEEESARAANNSATPRVAATARAIATHDECSSRVDGSCDGVSEPARCGRSGGGAKGGAIPAQGYQNHTSSASRTFSALTSGRAIQGYIPGHICVREGGGGSRYTSRAGAVDTT